MAPVGGGGVHCPVFRNQTMSVNWASPDGWVGTPRGRATGEGVDLPADPARPDRVGVIVACGVLRPPMVGVHFPKPN